jgi:hypothetical protein
MALKFLFHQVVSISNHSTIHPMKSALLLTCCFLPTLGWGQETALRNPWKAAPLEMPEAVAKARVQARTVLKGAGGSAGGNLIVEVIEPPVLLQAAPVAALSAAPLSEEELAARAARRAAEPNELRLFSPSVVVYENGVSLISWWTADRKTGYQEYSAFVNLDLSSIFACGDPTVGKRRYCMMAMAHKASDRFVAQVKPPALTEFKEPTDIILTKGDSTNQEALEPLMALLAKYDAESGLIESTAAAIKADQAARTAWEAEHPEPPEDSVIRFWPIQSTQYSTAPVK